VSYGTGSSPPTRTYLYTNTSFPSALTGVVDENGSTYWTWGYDSNGLANSSAGAGGVNPFLFVHNTDGSVLVTDALGAQRTYEFQTNSGVQAVTQITGPYCADCDSGATNTYDANGYLQSSTDWNSNVTGYTYSSGLLSQEVDGQGTSVQRTTNTTWDNVLRNPTELTVLNAAGTAVAKTDWTYNPRGEPLTVTRTDPATGATRTSTMTYCEAAGVSAGTCPILGLLLTVDGPRTDVSDVTTYAYYMSSASGCPTTCPYRAGDLYTVTNALGQVTTFTNYDGAGRLLSQVDANGVETDC
jgi:YD repeat-containing protein